MPTLAWGCAPYLLRFVSEYGMLEVYNGHCAAAGG